MARQYYRRYDPRLKNLVAESDDISQFHRLGIPNSTLRQWQKNGYQEFFTIPELGQNNSELIKENIALKSQLSAIKAEYDLVAKVVEMLFLRLKHRYLFTLLHEIMTLVRRNRSPFRLCAVIDLVYPRQIKEGRL